MATEKRLIDANKLFDDVENSKYDNPHTNGRVRINHIKEHDHFMKMIFDAPTVDAVEISRLGKLGLLLMPYEGCPRGRIGPRGYGEEVSGKVELKELDPIIDIDGNRWIPVLADDLEEFKKAIWKLACEKGGCNG